MNSNKRSVIWPIYPISIFFNGLFWYAIWVFFYLKFTDYSGIGIIETVSIISIVIFEIPTGAIADLFGKKYTLTIAFFFASLGNLIMAYSSNLERLLLSVIVMNFGYALFSGTFEAYIYDSLLVEGCEEKYDRILRKVRAIGIAFTGIAFISGGYLYKIDNKLPFLLCAISFFIAMFFTFFLKEPAIDSNKFSFRNYLNQIRIGFHALFKTKRMTMISIFLITISSIMVIDYEVLNDIQLYALGWNSTEMGYVLTISTIVLSLAIIVSGKIIDRIGRKKSLLITTFLMSLSFLISPVFGLYISTFLIILRRIFYEISKNISSGIINTYTESKNRSTAISTLNMISGLPYAVSAYFIGATIDKWSVNFVVLTIGSLLLLSLLPVFFIKSTK